MCSTQLDKEASVEARVCMIHRIQCGCHKTDPRCKFCDGTGVVEYEEEKLPRKWKDRVVLICFGTVIAVLVFGMMRAMLTLYRML
jgi:hypothetical protein